MNQTIWLCFCMRDCTELDKEQSTLLSVNIVFLYNLACLIHTNSVAGVWLPMTPCGGVFPGLFFLVLFHSELEVVRISYGSYVFLTAKSFAGIYSTRGIVRACRTSLAENINWKQSSVALRICCVLS